MRDSFSSLFWLDKKVLSGSRD